jgi:hypothetical protein
MRRCIGNDPLSLAAAALLVSCLPVMAADVPPFGPGLGEKADVVRAFQMKITGSVAKEVTGKKGDGRTALVGQCKPTTWANFGIQHGSAMAGNQAGIAVVTKGKIETGATGKFELEKIYVDLFSIDGANVQSFRFAGPGVLTLTTHDGSPGKRRMIGTIQGAKLKGLDDAKDKSIGVEASFDMDFSCGVK